jgi:hypothetical protein
MKYLADKTNSVIFDIEKNGQIRFANPVETLKCRVTGPRAKLNMILKSLFFHALNALF